MILVVPIIKKKKIKETKISDKQLHLIILNLFANSSLMHQYFFIYVFGLHGKVLVVMECCRGGFCEKTPEAGPLLNRASSSQL